MKRGTLVLPLERARHIVEKIGGSVQLQIDDMNDASMNRHYRKYIQRVDEMERMLRFIHEELVKCEGPACLSTEVCTIGESMDLYFDQDRGDLFKLDALESEISSLYHQFVRFKENNSLIVSQRNYALEEKYVAIAACLHLRTDTGSESHGSLFSTVAGILKQSEKERFVRTIFRASRGNAFVRFDNVEDLQQAYHPSRDLPATSSGSSTFSLTQSVVFVVYHQGNTDSALSQKIQKLCESFAAHIVPWPRTMAEARETIRMAEITIGDKSHAMVAYDKFLRDEWNYLFQPVGALMGLSPSPLPLLHAWEIFCAKEKGIYSLLNLFEFGKQGTTLRATCWFPAKEEPMIKELLASESSFGGGSVTSAMLLVDGLIGGGGLIASSSSQMIDSHSSTCSTNPPTYIKTNSLTGSFQQIVDTYGVPRYKEVNPAVFSIVSFPFFFGIMFGDFGHGMLLVLVALWLIVGDSNNKQWGGTLSAHKYMLLLMGVFSVYAGLLYSEFFGMGINLFGSRWRCPAAEGATSVECFIPDGTNGSPENVSSLSSTYPFGIDPAWSIASNQLIFVNSLKMKVAVLFGVAQMLLGLSLKVINSLYMRSATDLVCECVPQFLFLLALFGYMNFLIMYKWTNGDWQSGMESSQPTISTISYPPGIVDTLITMMLGFGQVNHEMFPGQQSVQSVLVRIIFWSVPVMLFPKPLVIWLQRRRYDAAALHEDRRGLIAPADPVTASSQDTDFSEVCIHQAIETIEFVLGTVSHTASYLRLWALSLAHQQLSVVFLHKILFSSMISGWPLVLNAIPIFVSFSIFFCVTVAILLGMDVMECFLHTLRLHWVEFQSKFYKGDGTKFAPFSHRSVVQTATGDGEF